jgi:hypothetical protein
MCKQYFFIIYLRNDSHNSATSFWALGLRVKMKFLTHKFQDTPFNKLFDHKLIRRPVLKMGFDILLKK